MRASDRARDRHLRLTTCDSVPTPTHSRVQLEPKPLMEPSAAGCRRPGDEDEPRDVGSAHSRAASAPQSRRRSRVALLAAAGACSNCSMILACECEADEQASCISWSCRASGWEARAAGGAHALIAESCNERQENRKRGGGKGAGAAATGGGACRRRRFASRKVPGSRIVAPWAAAGAGAASASLSLMSGAGACGEASSSLLSSKVMGGIESSSAACGGGSRAAVEAAESALRRSKEDEC